MPRPVINRFFRWFVWWLSWRLVGPGLKVSLPVALVFGVTQIGAGCVGTDTDPSLPHLITPSAARLAQLGAESTAQGTRAASGGQGEARAQRLGAAGFSTAADIQGFVEACQDAAPDSSSTRTPPNAKSRVKADANPSNATDKPAGLIHRGDISPTLHTIPDDGMFRWIEVDPEFLDPNKISETAGTAIGSQLFETLFVAAPGNTDPVYGAAASHTVSDDGLTWTFKIRPNLVWSDGTPLTAEDFRYAWLRGLDPITASRNAQQLWFIEGARAYNTGQVKTSDAVAIAVPDPLTLVVKLNNRAPYFPGLLSYIAYAPVPRHAVEAHGDQWTRPENIVTNGPFLMAEWLQRDRIVLLKNPKYWDADAVKLKGSIIFFSDSQTRNVLLYDTGQAHWANNLPSDRVQSWIQQGRSDLHVATMMCTYYYTLNTARPPFDDRLVRQAFNSAIDKETLTTQVLGTFQLPATHLVPDMFRQTLGYVPPEGPAFDARGAGRAMDRAIASGSSGPGGQEIAYNTSEGHKRIAQFVIDGVNGVTGQQMQASNMEWKSLLKKVHAGDFTVARTSWCADFADPLNFLSVMSSDGENNYSGYKNSAYDALLERIQSEGDRAKRNALICAAEKVLNADMPVVPFYFYSNSYLLRPEVRGFDPQYQDHHYLKWVSLVAPAGAGSDAGATTPQPGGN